MPGDLGHQHNFALSCILQNVFNAYLDVCDIDVKTYEFKTFALRLADEIMKILTNVAVNYNLICK